MMGDDGSVGWSNTPVAHKAAGGVTRSQRTRETPSTGLPTGTSGLGWTEAAVWEELLRRCCFWTLRRIGLLGYRGCVALALPTCLLVLLASNASVSAPPPACRHVGMLLTVRFAS